MYLTVVLPPCCPLPPKATSSVQLNCILTDARWTRIEPVYPCRLLRHMCRYTCVFFPCVKRRHMVSDVCLVCPTSGGDHSSDSGRRQWAPGLCQGAAPTGRRPQPATTGQSEPAVGPIRRGDGSVRAGAAADGTRRGPIRARRQVSQGRRRRS